MPSFTFFFFFFFFFLQKCESFVITKVLPMPCHDGELISLHVGICICVTEAFFIYFLFIFLISEVLFRFPRLRGSVENPRSAKVRRFERSEIIISRGCVPTLHGRLASPSSAFLFFYFLSVGGTEINRERFGHQTIQTYFAVNTNIQ